jgi:hypothetical protein
VSVQNLWLPDKLPHRSAASTLLQVFFVTFEAARDQRHTAS